MVNTSILLIWVSTVIMEKAHSLNLFK